MIISLFDSISKTLQNDFMLKYIIFGVFLFQSIIRYFIKPVIKEINNRRKIRNTFFLTAFYYFCLFWKYMVLMCLLEFVAFYIIEIFEILIRIIAFIFSIPMNYLKSKFPKLGRLFDFCFNTVKIINYIIPKTIFLLIILIIIVFFNENKILLTFTIFSLLIIYLISLYLYKYFKRERSFEAINFKIINDENNTIKLVEDPNIYIPKERSYRPLTKNEYNKKTATADNHFTKVINYIRPKFEEKRNVIELPCSDIELLKKDDNLKISFISSNDFYTCLFLHFFVDEDFKIDLNKIQKFNIKMNESFNDKFVLKKEYLNLLNDLIDMTKPGVIINLNDENIKKLILKLMNEYFFIFYKNVKSQTKYFDDKKITLKDYDYYSIDDNKIRLDSLLNALAYYNDTNIKIIEVENDKIENIDIISVNNTKNTIVLIRNGKGFNLCRKNKILAIN